MVIDGVQVLIHRLAQRILRQHKVGVGLEDWAAHRT
jgi:hypothetical protein